MRNGKTKKSISGAAALVLLGIFAVGILGVLLTGAIVYKELSERSALAYDSRTCVQYLSSKVRQASSSAAVQLSDFGDGDSLLIYEMVHGEPYQTQVYCYDGWLMELFTAADSGMEPEAGEKILPVQTLSLAQTETLLQVEVVDANGLENTFQLTLRGGGGIHEE